LPNTETFVSQSQTGSDSFTLSNNGNQISDTIATLPSHHTQTIMVTVKVNANVANNTKISNTATVSSSTPDPNPSNNSSTATTTVQVGGAAAPLLSGHRHHTILSTDQIPVEAGGSASQMGDTHDRGQIIRVLLTSLSEPLPVDLKRHGRAEVHIPMLHPQDDTEIRAMSLLTDFGSPAG
jgi:hypothetical protein